MIQYIYPFTAERYCIPYVCDNVHFFTRDFAILLVKIIKSHPVGNEAEGLPNPMKSNQNAQASLLYMWRKGLGGGLLR